jgi:Sulfatase
VFPVTRAAPAAAPNVLLILLDDVGFGATSTFGGPVPTPALEKLAQKGLRYNHWHTTALCSPTRAVLAVLQVALSVQFMLLGLRSLGVIPG